MLTPSAVASAALTENGIIVLWMVCGIKYRFEGIDTVTMNLNELSDRASKAVDDLKNGYEG